MTSLPETTAPGQKKLGLVIDLDTCVGCQACAVACKEWNTQGYSAPAYRSGSLWRRSDQGLAQSRPWLRGGRGRGSRIVHFPRSCLHCEEPPASPSARPVPPTSAPKTASCWSIPISASAASSAPGPALWAREMDDDEGVMKKCTLASTASTTSISRRQTASRPACGPARPARDISAISAIRTARLAARRRSRRPRSAARTRLSAGQQISAAGPRPGAPPRTEPPGDLQPVGQGGTVPSRQLLRLGRPGARSPMRLGIPPIPESVLKTITE